MPKRKASVKVRRTGANKQGHQPPTQKHEGQRTPVSRSDRASHVGADNQSRGRRGGPGSPSGEGR